VSAGRIAIGVNPKEQSALVLAADDATLSTIAPGKPLMAATFKAAGVGIESLPRTLGVQLALCGYTATDLRNAGYTTAELLNIGFTVNEIAEGCGDEVLTQLVELGGAVAMATNGTEAMRKAASSQAPDEEDVKSFLRKVSVADVAKLKKLTAFEFVRSQLTDDEGYAMLWTAAVERIPLTSINLTRNSMGKKTATMVGHLLRFNTTLESVDLHDNEVDDEGATAIGASFAFNHTLKTIRLSSNEMKSAGATAIYDGVMCNLGLASVTLEAGNGTQSHGVPLAKLKGLEPSHQIDLGGMRFGPLSALLVSKLIDTYRPELGSLILDRNPIKAEGAAAVGDMLTRNDDITEVHLRYCSIGPEGMAALAQALRINSSVERLYIITNAIGEVGCQALVEMLEVNSCITLIHMDDNLLSPASKDKLLQLAAKRGNLHIEV